MKSHLIEIKYKNDSPPAVYMARAFTRREILDIAYEICKNYDNIYYDELRTTIVCQTQTQMNKVMNYLINKFDYKNR